jgi:hypothetical protein
MIMAKAYLIGAALLLFQLGGTALANGPVIITQAKALVGGVTPGDAPGFPVSITAPGSYRLGGNLDVTAGRNGILVTSVNVSIDLDGFALNGTDATQLSVALSGIVASGIDTGILSIRHGTIIGFTKYGIFAPTTKVSAFDDLQIIANGADGIRAGGWVRITDSTIVNSGGWGIVCRIRCSVQTSVIADNTKGGIAITTGIVLGNTIEGTRGGGIIALYSAGAGNNTISTSIREKPTHNVFPLQPNFCSPVCQYAKPPAIEKTP